MANLSQDLDLDIFNDGQEEEVDFNSTDAPAEELEVTPEVDVTEDVTEEVPEEPVEEVKEDVPSEPAAEEEIDVDQLVAEIL